VRIDLKPIIGITLGDPAGIGPEIVIKAVAQKSINDTCKPLVIGDVEMIRESLKVARTKLSIHGIKNVEEALYTFGTIDVLDLNNINLMELIMGRPQAMTGRASFEYIKKAVELALEGKIDAITTAPISKEALHLAGINYPGHTEILADLTDERDFAMMFIAGSLRVILVTIHLSLLEACNLIKKDQILKTIRLGYQTLKKLGIETPKIAVAGLNPHASEGGLFGVEESEEIKPAIDAAREEGLDVFGPFPPDTVFFRAMNGEFDLVVAMYHDQGCIPIKLIGFNIGVNVTVGLQIVRTSPDHGTAYKRAGLKLGTGDPQSLIEAIKLAIQLTEKS
jgi:4-hydroxythreonine-4-phosphate dehydrogenase